MSSPDDLPQPRVLRTSPLALVGALFTLLAGLPLLLASPGPWSVLLVVPVLVGAWVLRVRTVVSTAGLSVQRVFSSREIGWEQVRGFHFRNRGWSRVVLTDETEVALPAVHLPHLTLLSRASGGRVPDRKSTRLNSSHPV